MYDKFYDLIKNNLNQRIQDPQNVTLLKQIMGSLKGMTVYIKLKSRLYKTFSEETVIVVKDAKYIGRQITIVTGRQTVKFPAVGIIVTALEDNIIIYAPNDVELDSNLTLRIVRVSSQ